MQNKEAKNIKELGPSELSSHIQEKIQNLKVGDKLPALVEVQSQTDLNNRDGLSIVNNFGQHPQKHTYLFSVRVEPTKALNLCQNLCSDNHIIGMEF